MRITKAVLLLVGALALAACTNPGRYGAGAGAGAGGAGAGLGSVNDPDSIAYFNQTIGNVVLFAVDQHTLGPEAQNILRAQAGWLRSHPGNRVLIEGHADEQGTRIYNINLGERRANSVREFLISQGIEAGRINTISYGKERPLAICSSESCYAQNRRAVTVLTMGAGV